ncbi:MAG: GNAT family N-acetyltransferase [Clostridiales bacterium]|jgi:RimJ/RimL family protein N-acetyltransferase|nr:GNAT family N-acetyltransferase [Clostridiales bacterium]
MKYIKKVIGSRVYLSPLCVEDADIYTKWHNDPEVGVNYGSYPYSHTIGRTKKDLENEKYSDWDEDFAIVLHENDTPIGMISVFEKSGVYRSAYMALAIGEAEWRGKGIGKEAVTLLLGYAFDTLNLHNMALYVYSRNTIATRLYKGLGFTEGGRLRQRVFNRGQYDDIIFMDILEDEYRQMRTAAH